MADWALRAMLSNVNPATPMPETLTLVGLLIGTLLYALLVRRRASLRQGISNLRDALAASNEIALQRLHLRPSPSASAQQGGWGDGVLVTDRRSGQDRRSTNHRRFGRGRRSGGDRRRS